MSWFRRTPPDEPTIAPEAKGLATPDDDLYALFGIVPTATSGIVLTPEAALKVPAVGSAIRVISEAVATLDVHVKRIDAAGNETPLPGHPALPFLRDAANDWTSGFELIRDLVIDALSSDVGGLAHVNRVRGEVQEIVRYQRGIVSVDFDTATGEPTYKIDGDIQPARDFIHLRSPFGRSPLTLYRDAIGTAAALDRHAARLFGRGARPSGALKFPKGMGEDSVRKARAAWRATHEGDDAGGRTAILYDGAEFDPFTFNSTDAQFLENRKFQVLEVARAFRVPPTMLFELDRATWSNTEQMGVEFLSYCLEPWLRAAEGAFRRALFTPEERADHAVRFDRDDLTRADLSTRSTVINSLIAAQVINPNEGRGWLGLPPRAGGETFVNPNIQTAPTDAQKGTDG
ncbi:phage portal protein [uncultured Jannaschia sp.]|uniref:phage portal protein n=1 Tax=uncultured Jannaschia sp. TaxID=293347 RepID=UPI00261579E8|nr:phage portal protein [uncultured Jannaschia sp.]